MPLHVKGQRGSRSRSQLARGVVFVQHHIGEYPFGELLRVAACVTARPCLDPHCHRGVADMRQRAADLVATRPSARGVAKVAPARSICDSIQPPKTASPA